MGPYRENAFKEDKKIAIEDIVNKFCSLPASKFQPKLSRHIACHPIYLLGSYSNNDDFRVCQDSINESVVYSIEDKVLREKIKVKREEVYLYYEQIMFKEAMEALNEN